jgi:hypothetical protein
LGFLGAWRFRREGPVYKPWIVLDFLGFSRPNPAFSMGYAGFSRAEFFSRLSLALRGAATGACGRGHAEAQDCSWRELNLISAFPQEIVVLSERVDDDVAAIAEVEEGDRKGHLSPITEDVQS